MSPNVDARRDVFCVFIEDLDGQREFVSVDFNLLTAIRGNVTENSSASFTKASFVIINNCDALLKTTDIYSLASNLGAIFSIDKGIYNVSLPSLMINRAQIEANYTTYISYSIL
jgi:hypothetical protein